MFLPIGNVKQVLSDFLQTEVLPKAAGGQGFVFGVAAGMLLRSLDSKIETVIPQLKAIGILDDQNRIDLEALHEEAGKTIDKTGSFNVMGYVLDKTDIDALYRIAQKYSTKQE